MAIKRIPHNKKTPVSRKFEVGVGTHRDSQHTVTITAADTQGDIHVSWLDYGGHGIGKFITQDQARTLALILLNIASEA
jgi:hypothetical protein